MRHHDAMPRQIYHLSITLADVRPAVWRRVAVPGGYTLDRVHRVIQLSMGWLDGHLHSFDIGTVQYGVPDADGLLDVRDEIDTRLDAVAGKDSRFVYTYDFGDWWEHSVDVEDVLDAAPGAVYPVCTAGKGDCPPEDVGGAYGYDRFRAVMADPTHPDYEATVRWFGTRTAGRDFDPERATALLRRMT